MIFALIVSLVARTKLKPPDYEPQHSNHYCALPVRGRNRRRRSGSLDTDGMAGSEGRTPAASPGVARCRPWVCHHSAVPDRGPLAPVSLVFMNATVGITETPDMLTGLADSIFIAPRIAFEYGALSLGPTALAAVLFIGRRLAHRSSQHILQIYVFTVWSLRSDDRTVDLRSRICRPRPGIYHLSS